MKQYNTSSGKVMIFSAPSGAGKSTVVGHLVKKYKWLGFSVSATSRKPRGNEKNGKEYYFFSAEQFKNHIHNDAFIEHEEVYQGRYYGTLKSEVQRLWDKGKIVLFDIDVQGALNLKKKYKENALTVFVMPPSLEVLEKRLKERGTDSANAVATRIAKAKQEISFSGDFDIILLNDKLEECLSRAEKITEDFYNKQL